MRPVDGVYGSVVDPRIDRRDFEIAMVYTRCWLGTFTGAFGHDMLRALLEIFDARKTVDADMSNEFMDTYAMSLQSLGIAETKQLFGQLTDGQKATLREIVFPDDSTEINEDTLVYDYNRHYNLVLAQEFGVPINVRKVVIKNCTISDDIQKSQLEYLLSGCVKEVELDFVTFHAPFAMSSSSLESIKMTFIFCDDPKIFAESFGSLVGSTTNLKRIHVKMHDEGRSIIIHHLIAVKAKLETIEFISQPRRLERTRDAELESLLLANSETLKEFEHISRAGDSSFTEIRGFEGLQKLETLKFSCDQYTGQELCESIGQSLKQMPNLKHLSVNLAITCANGFAKHVTDALNAAPGLKTQNLNIVTWMDSSSNRVSEEYRLMMANSQLDNVTEIIRNAKCLVDLELAIDGNPEGARCQALARALVEKGLRILKLHFRNSSVAERVCDALAQTIKGANSINELCLERGHCCTGSDLAAALAGMQGLTTLRIEAPDSGNPGCLKIFLTALAKSQTLKMLVIERMRQEHFSEVIDGLRSFATLEQLVVVQQTKEDVDETVAVLQSRLQGSGVRVLGRAFNDAN